jgi:Tfp pilus assembly protein FimT
MTFDLTDKRTREAFDRLVADIQIAETEANRLGLYITARGLNRAKDAAGWEASSPNGTGMAALAINGRAMDREKIGKRR